MGINKLSRIGVQSLNPMQQKVYDAFMKTSKDLIVLSPTGTGKTLAYLLPLIEKIDKGKDEVQAVIVVPGRELALQSHRVLSSFSDIRSCTCYGGGRMTMEEHKMLREKRPQVIFATPGRLIDHLDKGNIDINHILYLIIDEFDKCMNMGFEREMFSIVEKLPFIQRRILLSATNSNRINVFIECKTATKINELNGATADRIEIFQVRSKVKDKLETLYSLLCSLGDDSVIVFLNYRESVERVSRFLKDKGFILSVYHGGLEQEKRERSLYLFGNSSTNILICTDLASRGLDIEHVKHIVHYHIQEDENAYVHRIGRTARWDKTGKSYFILGPEEKLPDYIHQDIPEYDGISLNRTPSIPKMVTIYIGKGKNNKISKADILGFLCKKGELKSDDIGRIDIFPRYSYAAVDRKVVGQMLRKIKDEKIKGLRTIVEEID